MRLVGSKGFGLLLAFAGATSASGQASGGGRGGAANEVQEGAIFLLLPTGARAVALGHAVVASAEAGDAVWWNPAGIRATKSAAGALHHSQTFVGTGDAISVVFPTRRGAIALSASLLDNGGVEVTGSDSASSGGLLISRDVAVGLSYAVAVRRLRIGSTYKLVQFRFDCTGECPIVPRLFSTTGLDFGAQFEAPTRLPVTFGVAFRHIGVRRRGRDDERDRLPSRVQVGAQAVFSLPKRIADDARIVVAVDAIDDLPVERPLPRFGVELIWEKSVFVRGGYVVERVGSESGGPALGLGFVVRRLSIDFGRTFSGLSADAGQAPTYLSLKLAF
jgi:hypothetical protein